MNQHWKNFLLSENAHFISDTHINFPTIESHQQLYAIAHLTVLTVSGKDAGKFLQGQVTCNVHDITATQSSFGAVCNPKGRAITTFLLAKSGDDFLLLLPKELLQIVKERLQKYILRADVKLTDSSEDLCLSGIAVDALSSSAHAVENFLGTRQQDSAVRITIDNRCLFIARADDAITLWVKYSAQGFQASDSAQWITQDILRGIPWLTLATSEQFIPQMLNLDKLGGISLTKGCYTGQEVVARTHYLGKAKRALFVAECQNANPEPNTGIVDANGQVVGNVLLAQDHKMLAVLQLADADTAQLQLKDYNHAPVTLLTAESS